MFCISTNPNHLQLIKNLNYTPVGLGEFFFNNNWENDKYRLKKNISNKNAYYGEYTFHYKLWKNNTLPEKKWIGFCQYRKFWVKKKITSKILTFKKFKSITLQEIPKKINSYEVIIGNPLYVNQIKVSKIIKKNFKKILLDPLMLIKKKKRTIKFHFDLMHGDGNLEKAISVLDHQNKNDFLDFVKSEFSFNPHNMFICKNKKILMNYYDSVFPWLKKCEKIFGFKNLEGYGLKRIYGFLAERYLSYWFKKYTKHYIMPIYFKDLNDFLK